LQKTIVFVTHDIDEAVKMGDRIAILQVGGRLAQYDRPENILAEPADDFVADFVGRDRALKRLRITPIDLGALHTPAVFPSVEAARAAPGWDMAVVNGAGEVKVVHANSDAIDIVPTVAHDRPLQDALALMLERRTRCVAVTEHGDYRGLLAVDDFWLDREA
jgi:ABC-type proline/glycine betaine transport system ATPase subunit